MPVALSSFDAYATPPEETLVNINLDESWDGENWTYKGIADMFAHMLATTVLQPKEDKTFKMEYIPVSIESYLRKEGTLTLLDFEKPKHLNRVKQLQRTVAQNKNQEFKVIIKPYFIRIGTHAPVEALQLVWSLGVLESYNLSE